MFSSNLGCILLVNVSLLDVVSSCNKNDSCNDDSNLANIDSNANRSDNPCCLNDGQAISQPSLSTRVGSIDVRGKRWVN